MRRKVALGIKTARWEKQSRSKCSVIRATRNLWRLFLSKREVRLQRTAFDLHKNIYKDEETSVQASEKLSRPPNRACQEKVVATRLDCNHEDRELFCAQRRISLNLLLLKNIHQTIKRTHRHHDRQREGRSESVHVNDLDVFVT